MTPRPPPSSPPRRPQLASGRSRARAMLSVLRRGRAGHAVGARPMSLMVKASPTVQRLIRAAGLESYPLTGTGPKGIVTDEDVSVAKAAKAVEDEAARQPVTIDLKPLKVHNLDESYLPTSAVTNKAELMQYYETMCALMPSCVGSGQIGLPSPDPTSPNRPCGAASGSLRPEPARAIPTRVGHSLSLARLRPPLGSQRYGTVCWRRKTRHSPSECRDPHPRCSKVDAAAPLLCRYTMRRMEIAADVLYKGKFVAGFCHLYDGQEAIGMGIEAATTYGDSIVTSYRDHTYQYTRGDKIENVLGELLGK